MTRRHGRPLLLADIGGTYARFAVLAGDRLGPIRTLDVHAHGDVAAAIARFLEEEHDPPVGGALLAVAGPVDGGRCRLVNSAWIVDGAALRQRFGLSDVRVVNDHEAAACGLARLGPSDTIDIGGKADRPDAPMAVLGPGTGLGMACRLSGSGGGTSVVVSEGGHATLAAATDRESALIGILRRRFGHVSAERVLSGPGLVNLYEATAELDHLEAGRRSAPEITHAAVAGTCDLCRRTLEAFCMFLGSVAGDVALLFAARGGVFVTGGIVPQFADYVARSEFRQRFEAKGRFASYLAAVPTRIVVRPNFTFRGLEVLAGAIDG